MILRGSLGLGDAIYTYPAVKYYVEHSEDVTVVTRYPEIFATLACKTISEEEWKKTSPLPPYIDCSCSARTIGFSTNIFEDTLIQAGIKEKLPLKFEYNGNPRKYETDLPVCIVRTPSFPVKGDESARCMVPDIAVFQRIINAFSELAYFVAIGWPVKIAERLEVDLDLTHITNLMDYIGAIDGADVVITQPGHGVPIAEALGKHLLTIFSAEGFLSPAKRYRFTTPQKILTSPKSKWIKDKAPVDKNLTILADIFDELEARK